MSTEPSLMRLVIDFLNELHNEQRNYKNGDISETPLKKALDETTLQPLDQIPSDNLVDKFVSPKPAEREQTGSDIVWIRYNVPVESYDAVQKNLGLGRAGEVGLKTFEYFYTREIED